MFYNLKIVLGCLKNVWEEESVFNLVLSNKVNFEIVQKMCSVILFVYRWRWSTILYEKYKDNCNRCPVGP